MPTAFDASKVKCVVVIDGKEIELVPMPVEMITVRNDEDIERTRVLRGLKLLADHAVAIGYPGNILGCNDRDAQAYDDVNAAIEFCRGAQ